MSLMRYEDARPWAKSIKKMVASRKMPPWDADPGVGKFLNDPTLSDEEIALISKWVDFGAPEGDARDLPPALEFPTGWSIGEPDMIIPMQRSISVPASGNDMFIYEEIPTGLTEDRWISAVEVMPGSRRAVHHIMVYVVQEEEFDEEWSEFLGRHGDLLIEHAAGNNGDVFPAGTGRLLKAGSKLIVQIHYHPYGTAEQDRSRIGLKFAAKDAVEHRVVAKPIADFGLLIPAGANDYVHEANHIFQKPARLISFQPHMHFRGKSMKLEAFYPDGRSEVLCSVSEYNPFWQITYAFKTPPLMPPGTRLHVTAHFDNSASNPNNPDPTANVHWGPQAVDEMMIGWTDFVYVDDKG